MKGEYNLTFEEANYYQKTFQKYFQTPRPCCYNGCKEITSDNHVFSKKILKIIADSKQEVWYFDFHFFESSLDAIPIVFSKIGIKRIKITPVSMQSLCGYHDKIIFSPVEDYDANLDLNDAYNHLLLAYKVSLHEFYKQESVVWAINDIVNNPDFFQISLKRPLFNIQDSFEKSMPYLKSVQTDIKGMMEESIFGKPFSHSFEYKNYKINRKIEFYLCAVINLKPAYYEGSRLNEFVKYEHPRNIFINFIPQVDHTLISISGYALSAMGSPLESFFVVMLRNNPALDKDDESTILKYVSDLALSRCDTWCFSNDFYESLIQHREKDILEIRRKFGRSLDKSEPVGDLCLFWND